MRTAGRGWVLAGVVVVAAALLTGCRPLRRFAMNQVAGILAEGTETFHQDNDPELIADALPFALKMIEATLNETPRHQGLLIRACSGFTEYAYGFVKQDADEVEEDDYARAKALRVRARKLFLRARDYGLRCLELRYPGLAEPLRMEPREAVAKLRRTDVELAYWIAVSWGAAISVSKDDPDLVADQVVVEALLDRALVLNPSFDEGAIHQALIAYEMVRRGASGKPEDRARRHFERAVALSGGNLAAPYVSYAEEVALLKQDRETFEALLQEALAIDIESKPEARTVNLMMQRRARWLLSGADDLFLPPLDAVED